MFHIECRNRTASPEKNSYYEKPNTEREKRKSFVQRGREEWWIEDHMVGGKIDGSNKRGGYTGPNS